MTATEPSASEAKQTRPKKPPGWSSKGEKAKRKAERIERRRRRRHAEAVRRLRRRRHEAKVRAANAAKYLGAADRSVARIQAISEAEKARQPKSKKKKKAAKIVAHRARPVDEVAKLVGKGKIKGNQRRAAEEYRDAYDLVQAYGMSGTLDPGKTGGGAGAHTGGLPEAIEDAAGVLNRAERLLGSIDYRVIREIIGDGCSIEEVAKGLYGDASRAHLGLVQDRFVDALTMLAAAWYEAARERSTIVGSMAPGARPVMSDARKATVERGRVAHAGGDKSASYSASEPTKRKAKGR